MLTSLTTLIGSSEWIPMSNSSTMPTHTRPVSATVAAKKPTWDDVIEFHTSSTDIILVEIWDHNTFERNAAVAIGEIQVSTIVSYGNSWSAGIPLSYKGDYAGEIKISCTYTASQSSGPAVTNIVQGGYPQYQQKQPGYPQYQQKQGYPQQYQQQQQPGFPQYQQAGYPQYQKPPGFQTQPKMYPAQQQQIAPKTVYPQNYGGYNQPQFVEQVNVNNGGGYYPAPQETVIVGNNGGYCPPPQETVIIGNGGGYYAPQQTVIIENGGGYYPPPQETVIIENGHHHHHHHHGIGFGLDLW